MYVSASKAEKKWCPMARDRDAGETGVTSTNTDGNCVSSDCMMWRWADDETLGPDKKGYCGLAGIPHD